MIEANLHDQYNALNEEEKCQLYVQMAQGNDIEIEDEAAYGDEEGGEFDLNNYGPEELANLDPEILRQLQEQQMML